MATTSRRGFLRNAAAMMAAFGTAPVSRLMAAAKTSKPNIIIVLTDDQGYGDLSCHGNPVLKTPNIDKLYRESTRLTDFHVEPMCSPTRGQLLTGLDALRNGATSVTAGRTFLRPGIPTMADLFAAGGYRTGIFGKWHLGDNYPHRPMEHGFQDAVYIAGWGVGSASAYWKNSCFDTHYFENGEPKQLKGYCTDFWFDRAMDWMKARKEKAESFFCYLPTNAPHGPHQVAPKYSQPYEGQGPAPFFGMIANIDENIGRLEQFLTANGLRDNTIVIFMTDNGGTAGTKVFNAGMRGSKTGYYDGGHRVPCFVRWPAGGVRVGVDVDAPTQIQDLLPTLLNMCSVSAPKTATFDGTSVAGLLTGAAKTLPDRMLVVQYGQTPTKGKCAVIWNKWRLVNGDELFDIKEDPEQKRNVAGANPEVLKRMREYYDKWWAGIEPKLNEFVPIVVGSDKENPVRLSCSDWQDVYCDNVGAVETLSGGPRGGAWNIDVVKAAEYEIAVRRLPIEANRPIAASDDKTKSIAQVRMLVAGQDVTRKVAAGDKEIVFRLKLPAGRAQLHAWFADANGKDVCGAYYAYVKHV